MSLSDLGLPSQRTLVMGILNVTPDSFADGGRYDTTEKAIARAKQMLHEGVDIIDVGGESTRPGAERISESAELERVIPVITEVAKFNAIISIDTSRAFVAESAISAGARIINDVSGGLADPEMLGTAAKLSVPYIAMHSRGESKTMQERATYKDVVGEVIDELKARLTAAEAAGISRSNLVIDPGLGFAKESSHNWQILNCLTEFTELGLPLLIGASRKRFLGEVTSTTSPDDREAASIALTALLAAQRVWGVRVHSVKAHCDAIAVAGALND